jgi:hypothetical protein
MHMKSKEIRFLSGLEWFQLMWLFGKICFSNLLTLGVIVMCFFYSWCDQLYLPFWRGVGFQVVNMISVLLKHLLLTWFWEKQYFCSLYPTDCVVLYPTSGESFFNKHYDQGRGQVFFHIFGYLYLVWWLMLRKLDRDLCGWCMGDRPCSASFVYKLCLSCCITFALGNILSSLFFLYTKQSSIMLIMLYYICFKYSDFSLVVWL